MKIGLLPQLTPIPHLYTTWGILHSGSSDLQHSPKTDVENASCSGIPRQSLPSAVADKLRDQIIRGEIPEGAQLRQDAIANQYQVSRIPVREALRQLDAEGLIAIVPNRGAIVPALSPNDIGELFSIRALLEPEVLKLSIPRLTEDDFSDADAVLQKYVSEFGKQEHVSAWGRLNWQFHSILYCRANQPRFMAIIRNVNNSGERYTRLQLYLTHGMKRANQEHHQILELCRERNVVAACNLLREHILHAGNSLKEVLEQGRIEAQRELENAGRIRNHKQLPPSN
jgi:DNA-binding GntR family transcriptional regulator